MQTLKNFSSPILRIGLALVFLWFGFSQVSDPSSWTAYIPDWVIGISHMTATTIVYANGAFEIVFGVSLLLGFFTRVAAFLLFIHMADITFTVGFDAIGVRDFGLTIATFVAWINGVDFLTLDAFMHTDKSTPPEQKI